MSCRNRGIVKGVGSGLRRRSKLEVKGHKRENKVVPKPVLDVATRDLFNTPRAYNRLIKIHELREPLVPMLLQRCMAGRKLRYEPSQLVY